MDQSHRPGRWVQIFLLVSILCGVSQICSLAQNATQSENVVSEEATQTDGTASKEQGQASISGTIPDISGVWATSTGRNSGNFIITHAPAGSAYQFQNFVQGQTPLNLRWLPEQKLFEVLDTPRYPNHKFLIQPFLELREINHYSIGNADSESNDNRDLDWPSMLVRLASPDTANEALKEFRVQSLKYQGEYGRNESAGLILTETAEGLAAYSKSVGRWDKINVPRSKSHRPRIVDFTLNKEFAAAAIDDQLIGYSSELGHWTTKTIPAELIGKVTPVLNENTAYAQVGNKFYTLSSTTGEWTSPDDPAAKPDEPLKASFPAPVGSSPPKPTALGRMSAEPATTAQGFRFSIGTNAASTGTPVAAVPQVQLNSSEAQALAQQLASQEQSATNLAEQVRKQASTLGNDHPTTRSLRDQLGSALSAALHLKFELELLQVKQLQSQLSRLQEQIGQRKAQRQKIIDRRVNELLDDDATKWNSTPNVSASPTRIENEPELIAELAQNSSANELYGLGVTYMKRGFRQSAYLYFKAASESKQPLDAVLRQQLNDFLRELAPSSESSKSSTSRVVPTRRKQALPSSVAIDATVGSEKTGIQFSGPKGTTVFLSYDQDGHRMSGKLPVGLDLPENSQTTIEFVTAQEMRFNGVLAIAPIKPHTRFFWDKRDIQLSIDDEDLAQLAASNPVKKVVYLPEQSIAKKHTNSDVGTVVSTRLDSGTDPVTEADRRGAVLLSLSLSPGVAAVAGKTPSGKEQSASLVQRVSFSGPEGLKISANASGKPILMDATEALPYTHQVRRPSELQPAWKFSIPGEQSVFGTLYVSPVKTQTRAYWLTKSAPLIITRDDLAEAARGDLITKVVYLSEDSIRDPQNAIAETLETTGLASENPVEEADRRGAVLAILHLSQKELSPQARLVGPEGLSGFQPTKNSIGTLPLTLEELSASGSQHSFEFLSHDGQKFYGSLNVASVKGHTQFFWQAQVPQFEFTPNEIKRLATKGLITKAYYLSENSIRNPSQAIVESVDSLTSPSGTDVVSEADVRGAVLAVLKLAPTREQLTLPNASGTKSASSTSNEQSVKSGQFGRTPFEFGGPAPLRSKISAASSPPITGMPSGLDAPNIDAVVRLRNAQASVKNAQKRLELVGKRSPVSEKELRDVKLELDRAERLQENVLEEVKFSLRDLELQLESLKAETELLAQEQKTMESLNSAARATPSEVASARLNFTKSKSALERLKHRVDYFQRAIQDQKTAPPQEKETEVER